MPTRILTNEFDEEGCSIYKCLVTQCYHFLTQNEIQLALGHEIYQICQLQSDLRKKTKLDGDCKPTDIQQCLHCKISFEEGATLIFLHQSTTHVLCSQCLFRFLKQNLKQTQFSLNQFKNNVNQLVQYQTSWVSCPFICTNQILITKELYEILFKESYQPIVQNYQIAEIIQCDFCPLKHVRKFLTQFHCSIICQTHLTELNFPIHVCPKCKRNVGIDYVLTLYFELGFEEFRFEQVETQVIRKKCITCQSSHNFIKNQENQIQRKILCDVERCRHCLQAYHQNPQCDPDARYAQIMHQRFGIGDEIGFLPCPFCLCFTIIAGINDSYVKAQCSECQYQVCKECAAPYEMIQNHGPSFHRKDCSKYKPFPKIPSISCKFCEKDICKRPANLENMDIPEREKFYI